MKIKHIFSLADLHEFGHNTIAIPIIIIENIVLQNI